MTTKKPKNHYSCFGIFEQGRPSCDKCKDRKICKAYTKETNNG